MGRVRLRTRDKVKRQAVQRKVRHGFKVINTVLIAFLSLVGFTSSFMVVSTQLEPTPLYSYTNPIPQSADILALQERINDVLAEYSDKNFDYALKVVSLEQPQIFFDHQSTLPFIPASNLKVITTAVALDLLTPEFTFPTDFYSNRAGNLYVVPYGDPTWNDNNTGVRLRQVFGAITDSLRAKGVRRINGDLIVETDTFKDFPIDKGWKAGNRSAYYSSRPSNIAFIDNAAQIRITPSTPNEPANIDIFPYSEGWEIVNEVITTPTRSQQTFTVLVDSLSNSIKVSGRIWTRTKMESRFIAVPKPDLYALQVLKQGLIEHKIEIEGEARHDYLSASALRSEGYRKLFSLQSPPLTKIITTVNKNSNNFFANQLFLTIGKRQRGVWLPERTIKMWLTNNGIPTENLRMTDGSGLSPLNLCTAEQLVYTLIVMYNSPYFEDYKNSFAIAGVDGTLKGGYKDEAITKGNVWGKSGYILGVRALTGYILTADNELLAYSFIVNRDRSRIDYFREMTEKILVEIASFERTNL